MAQTQTSKQQRAAARLPLPRSFSAVQSLGTQPCSCTSASWGARQPLQDCYLPSVLIRNLMSEHRGPREGKAIVSIMYPAALWYQLP